MYREWIPDPSRFPCLQAVWLAGDETAPRKILPDNCTDIIIPLESSRRPRFVGRMTSYLLHHPSPGEVLLGLRFRPGYAGAIMREEMHHFTDRTVDLSLPLESALREIGQRFSESRKMPQEPLARLFSGFYTDYTPDPHITAAVDLLRGHAGNLRIEDLALRLCLSRRMLEKKFRRILGITPKRFARIERFRDLLRKKGDLRTTRYYDQPHLIKEFKAFTGVPPSEFFS